MSPCSELHHFRLARISISDRDHHNSEQNPHYKQSRDCPLNTFISEEVKETQMETNECKDHQLEDKSSMTPIKSKIVKESRADTRKVDH